MIKLPLRGGEFAIIDDEDAWALEHSWYLNKTSPHSAYARNRKLGYLHRLIVKPPKYKVVDHINGDMLDCRRSNLRVVTCKINSINRPRNRESTTLYKGVTRKRQKFLAQIKNDRKFIYIGVFATAALAALAYDLKAIELWGEYAYTNFPREIIALIKESKDERSAG